MVSSIVLGIVASFLVSFQNRWPHWPPHSRDLALRRLRGNIFASSPSRKIAASTATFVISILVSVIHSNLLHHLPVPESLRSLTVCYCINYGCHRFGASLFLRLAWDTSDPRSTPRRDPVPDPSQEEGVHQLRNSPARHRCFVTRARLQPGQQPPIIIPSARPTNHARS